MEKFTVWCRDESGEGTTWIETVEAMDVANAKGVALMKCAKDWGICDEKGYSPIGIVVIGIARGDVEHLPAHSPC